MAIVNRSLNLSIEKERCRNYRYGLADDNGKEEIVKDNPYEEVMLKHVSIYGYVLVRIKIKPSFFLHPSSLRSHYILV